MTPAEQQQLLDEAIELLRGTTVGYANHSIAWQNNRTTKWWQALDRIGRVRASLSPEPPAPSTLERKGYASGGSLPSYPPAERAEELTKMAAAGAKWCRIDLAWSVIERQQGVFNFAAYEGTVAEIRSSGFHVLGCICYTPAWANGGHTDDKWAPLNAADYGIVVGKIAEHFKGKVAAYELGNEPNIEGFWKPKPASGGPEMMAAMLKAAYPRIKAADPAAIVLTPGTSPAGSNGTDVDPREYLERLYAAGAKGSFDAVAHHPYYGPHPLDWPKDWSAWSQMHVPKGTGARGALSGPMSKPSLRETMIANGDGFKQIWATETNMLVQAQTIDGYRADEARQAVLVREALQAWLTFPWGGVLCHYNFRNHPGFSFRRPDGTLTPAYNAYRDAPGQ